MLPDALGAIAALASAVSWGGGDFSGAFASRRHRPFQVLALSLFVSLPVMLGLNLITAEGLPSLRSSLLATAAGSLGTLGLAAFYEGISKGRVALVAPVSSVIGAVVPVLVGLISAGLPGPLRLIGFIVALAAIWLVSLPQANSAVPLATELRYGVLAGLGFGAFLTLIALVDPDKLFAPLVVSKSAGLLLCLLVLRQQNTPLLGPAASRAAVLAGLLDSGGNIFYLFGTQLTRLDVVAALASLFPAFTVILGRLVFREQISLRQWAGVALSLVAIRLITL